MSQTIIRFFVFFLFAQSSIAQSITAKVVDAATGESIPYAGIKLSETNNLISNAEGYFTLSEAASSNDAVIVVSYLGYSNSQLTVAQLKSNNLIVKLTPAIFELENVNVAKPDPKTIMTQVKANLNRNYFAEGEPTKDMIFYRRANQFRPKKLEVEIDKSTGFNKDALKKVNAEIAKFTSSLITNPPVEYTDILCNYYDATTKKDDKLMWKTKVDVVKATKLKDENRSTSLEELQKSATNLFLKHLDTTKYYRVKSGWFGSRDTISLRSDYNKKKNKKEKKSNITSTKNNLNGFLMENTFTMKSEFDFVHQIDWYTYKYEGAMYSNENEFVYVLSFRPRKSKAKYVGKLYISETDYAVVKVEYSLDEGEIAGGLNLKLILGVKFQENVNQGTLIYRKSANGAKYRLHYASIESGQYIYLNRPVKFIELTEGEKDLLALDLKVEGNATEKTEFLNVSATEISATEFDKVKEDDFTYTKLKRYDPKIWKDHAAIEPLEEMKQFKAE